MKIRRISLQAEELAKLPPSERSLFFLVGHINNEIGSVEKIFNWCLEGANAPGVAEIEADAATAQGMIYARIMAGKLQEAWSALEKSWFASKPGEDIAELLHPVAATSLEEIKSYFKSKNLVYAVRNSFSFHYNPDALGEQWELAAKERFFEVVIGIDRGNSFNHAAELVANVAVFHSITPGDSKAGLTALFTELECISEHFRNFCEGVTRAMLEKMSGESLDHLGTLSDITPARRYSEVSIPVFCLPDEDADGVLP